MATNNAINAPIPFSLTNGGTGAALTASNGGIFYSNASTAGILAGTATAGQLLVSGSLDSCNLTDYHFILISGCIF